MKRGKANTAISLDQTVLDQLMPMHVRIRESGHIAHVGPTMAGLHPDQPLGGRRFLEVFEMRRPRKDLQSIADLRGIAGQKLQLTDRREPLAAMKGMIVDLPPGQGLLANLSFGISIVDAVRRFSLTNQDFAPTDLAIELLYLVEAKNAVMDESRNLNQRLQIARMAAEEQATTDQLTGLPNRRAIDGLLADLVERRASFGLMHMDLDFFKQVNDTFGHAAGDHVLQVAADVMKSEIRDADTAGRVGGDEFVLIFDRLTDQNKISKIGERIIRKLEEPVMFDNNECRISGSAGITVSSNYSAAEMDQMLHDADVALYESKRRGRACVTQYSPALLAAE